MTNQKKELQKAIADDVPNASAPDDAGEGIETTEEPKDSFSPLDGGSASKSSGILDTMLSTEPNPPLEEVEPLWKPEEGGISRVQRGINKMGGVDTTSPPAIMDIVIGIVEEMKNRGMFEEVEEVEEGANNENKRF